MVSTHSRLTSLDRRELVVSLRSSGVIADVNIRNNGEGITIAQQEAAICVAHWESIPMGHVQRKVLGIYKRWHLQTALVVKDAVDANVLVRNVLTAEVVLAMWITDINIR